MKAVWKIFAFGVFFTSMVTAKKPLEFDAKVMVGGNVRKARYKISHTRQNLFDRKEYSSNSGKVIKVLGPNRFLVQTDSRTQEFVLIGLMDLSPGINGSLRTRLMQKISRIYLGKELRFYTPKDFKDQGLSYNHAYVLQGEKMVNNHLLKEGLGIVPANLKIKPLFKEHFHKLTEKAASEGQGIFGEEFKKLNEGPRSAMHPKN